MMKLIRSLLSSEQVKNSLNCHQGISELRNTTPVENKK